MHRTSLIVTSLLFAACGLNPAGADPSRSTSRAAELSCPTSPANQTFGAALCLCGDSSAVGEGTWVSGGPAGINGKLDVVGQHHFSGDLVAYQGVGGVGSLQVAGSLATAGDLDAVGDMYVRGDLSVAGALESVGQLRVDGTLRTPDAGAASGVIAHATGPLVPLAGPPCACGAQALDVAGAVAMALGANDNDAGSLGPTESVGQHDLRLGSGRYVFTGASAVGAHLVTVDGAVAMYVKGNLQGVGLSTLRLTPGSTLDLYVDGEVDLVGTTTLGEADPGAVRLYVSSGHAVRLVGESTLVGSVYAPGADLQLVGTTHFTGALFSRSLLGVGKLDISYAAPTGPVCGEGVPVVPGFN